MKYAKSAYRKMKKSTLLELDSHLYKTGHTAKEISMGKKPNMYDRAQWLTVNLAIWKKRIKRIVLVEVGLIALFLYAFIVPMGKEENRSLLVIISLLLVAGWTTLLVFTYLTKPTEAKYRIDH